MEYNSWTAHEINSIELGKCKSDKINIVGSINTRKRKYIVNSSHIYEYNWMVKAAGQSQSD